MLVAPLYAACVPSETTTAPGPISVRMTIASKLLSVLTIVSMMKLPWSSVVSVLALRSME